MYREMSQQEQMYFAEKLTKGKIDSTVRWFLNNQIENGQNFVQQAGKLYVCERCESGALPDGTGYTCPHCSYKSATRSTRVRDYIKGGFYR